MSGDKRREIIKDALNWIDTTMASLDAYPELEDASMQWAQGKVNKYMGKFFPTQLDFSKEILEHLVGPDVLIDIVSKFLIFALPEVEIGIKSALLANMQNLGTSCEIDPIIYEKAIKEGIIFDLRQIDLYDKLTVSPLDEKIGQYYYFGVEDCESSYDVLMSAIDPNNQPLKKRQRLRNEAKQGTSYYNRMMDDSVGHYFGGRKRDFDCLLWYMKNKGGARQVWGKRTTNTEDLFNGGDDIKKWIEEKGTILTNYYTIEKDKVKIWFKDAWGNVTEKTEKYQNAKAEPLSEGMIYVFKDFGLYYKYQYENVSITKLNRKDIYAVHNEGTEYTFYYFGKDDKGKEKWVSQDINRNFNTIEDAIKKGNIKEDNFITIDLKPYKVTKVVKKNGTIKEIKKVECSDITNAFKKNTTLFIDYDEKEEVDENGVKKTKRELLDEGKTPVSSLDSNNKGQKKWKKSLLWMTEKKWEEYKNEPYYKLIDYGGKDDRGVEKGLNYNCYYIDVKKAIKNGEREYEGEEVGDAFYNKDEDKIIIPPHESGNIYVYVDKSMDKHQKYTKDFGVLTLEYSPRTGNLLQSDGSPMHQQTPYDNVLHVFFGNVKEIPSENCKKADSLRVGSYGVNKDMKVFLKLLNNLYKKHLSITKEYDKELEKNKIDAETYNNAVYANNFYNYISNGSNGLDKDGAIYSNVILSTEPGSKDYDDINFLVTKIANLTGIVNKFKDRVYEGGTQFNYELFLNMKNEILQQMYVQEMPETKLSEYYTFTALLNKIKDIIEASDGEYYLQARNCAYPEARKNYYLKKTLLEFNTDYINSIQLFDAKVLVAQIISALFTGGTIEFLGNAGASWKTELIRDVVKDIVQKTIASEDFVVSDCFFTFTNDTYNGMLRAAELRQAGLYSQHGEENGNKNIDLAKMLEGLNEIDSSADKNEQVTTIGGTIRDISVEVSKDVYKENNGFETNIQYGVQVSFIEKLITELCTQLVMAILSPKVYLLILINLELFGMTTTFDLRTFIQNFESLIRNMVKSVVDQFMDYINQQIEAILAPLKEKLVIKLSFEQVEMYSRLIKQILMHLRILLRKGRGEEIGWTQDVVGYADITESEATQEPIDEC